MGTQAPEVGPLFSAEQNSDFQAFFEHPHRSPASEANEGDTNALAGLCVSTPPPLPWPDEKVESSEVGTGPDRVLFVASSSAARAPPHPPFGHPLPAGEGKEWRWLRTQRKRQESRCFVSLSFQHTTLAPLNNGGEIKAPLATKMRGCQRLLPPLKSCIFISPPAARGLAPAR